ncbi:hypothetical protein LNKW23_43880 [Paralimibaculum aggregatum]|uniref:DUF1468 domain-containing protein n=1 Tax=Paralimibaculum aggregatum TaxID=3036245 RepID=A0ABQ6LSW9_9RHOB|nr:hypothetical protein LNKW23_43880 [Limibaculum sp. NKW23]
MANAILFIFGISFLVYINPTFTSDGDGTVVSPRLLPEACAVVIVVCTGGLLARDLVARIGRSVVARADAESQGEISRIEFASLAAVTALLCASVALFLWAGPLWGSILLISGSQLLSGERSPVALILTPVCLTAGAYVLFYHVLGTSVA